MSNPSQKSYSTAILAILIICAGLLAMKKLNDIHFIVEPEKQCVMVLDGKLTDCDFPERD